MHAFMAAVLLRMARLDALDGNAEAQPPNGESAQVEETVGRSEGHAVVGTNGLRQALFLNGLHGLAEQKVTAGVIGNGQGVTIPLITQHELALVVGAPQGVRSASLG